MNNETKVVLSIGVVFVLFFSLLLWLSAKPVSTKAVNQEILIRDLSHMTGQKNAKVTLVEFADYECPACAAFNETVKRLIEKYGVNPEFNFVSRNFPLPQHKNAMIAAEAAESAAAQDKYFQMSDLLYKNQGGWSTAEDPTEIFVKYATELSIDTKRFKEELVGHKYLGRVKEDASDSAKLKLDHTPTLFINGIEQNDLSPITLKEKIDTLLNEDK